VGTTNQSDVLANRTKKLIQEVKPDVVFVQSDENWWKAAQFLGHVKSQDEMNLAKKELSSVFKDQMAFNGRRLAYDVRRAFLSLWSKLLFGVNLEFNPFLPGLEVKYALEEATKLNSNIVFLGYEFDKKTNARLHHENRNTILKSIVNSIKLYSGTAYSIEMREMRDQLHSYGIKKFLESSCDQYFINW
jgi:hypothetical protein